MSKRVPCQACLGTGEIVDQRRQSRLARHYLKVAKLTQSTVASKIGVSATYLSDVFNNRRDWNLDLWNKVLKACGVMP